ARPGNRIEPTKDIPFYRHILEHGLDDEIGSRKVFDRKTRRQQRHGALDVRLREAPAAHGAFVVAADRGDTAVERCLVALDDRHGDAYRQEVHGDAAAHRAGAEDADAADRDERRVRRDIVDISRSAFRLENMRLRLRRIDADRRAGMALLADHPCTLAISEDFEQTGGADSAGPAHRDNAVAGAAALAFMHQMADAARTRHAVGMADRNRAAG